MSSAKSFSEVKETVEKWWHSLQFERKCNSTNSVQKIVNNSSPEFQEQVRQVLVEEIKRLIENCFKSRNLNDLQRACNAINGCFDNFVHAVDAVRLLFSQVISFIDFGLTECEEFPLNARINQKNALLQLLHSLSRILILVLKLKRSQNLDKVKSYIHRKSYGTEDLQYDPNCKFLLSSLTHKIGRFLLMDDILIDTKNNLSMSGILLREILAPDENALIQFHKNFIKSIPASLSDEDLKLNILKFLIGSAIINTWSINIIDSNSTCIYLKFFISLCEKYSSETPIVLNTSRTLLLLIKHDSFKEFISSASEEQIKRDIPMLLSCIFMLLEHPVPCVRNSAKDFLQLLAAHPSLHPVMVEAVFKLPNDKRSYFISVGALAKEIGTEILMENNSDLPKQLIAALCDPTIVSHVSLALEYVILNDGLAEENFSKWCETWIMPLLISLMNVFPIVAADIEKLLEKAFKKYPESVVYVINKWANPSSGEELRYVITALKISQKQGFELKGNSISDNTEGREDSEKELINENLLEHCLHQRDDDIRITAFSLVVEAKKSTKLYSERDFKLILYFLKYNLNNQQASTRQKILGLIRKMLVRFSESKATLLKPSKNEGEQAKKSKICSSYDRFLDSLTMFCFSNIFVGCNFNRLNLVLNILVLCFENVKNMSFSREMTDFYWSKFLIALDSSYEENKALAVVLAQKLDLSCLEANKPSNAKILYEKAFNLCTHMEPPDVLTGSYLLNVLMNLPSSKQVLSSYFEEKSDLDDVAYYCIRVLQEKLKEQIQLAKLDLMTAATCGPMYGALFAIRLILKSVDLAVYFDGREWERSALDEWGRILNELVDLSFDMTKIVGCVVNSSSPEGHLPMDFQTNFENLLSLNEKFDLKGSGDFRQPREKDAPINLLRTICNNFFKKFKKLKSRCEGSDCDTYESLRGVNCLLKENHLLIRETHKLSERISMRGENDSEEIKLLEKLMSVKVGLELLAEKLQKVNAVTEWPATAQVLLLCAWRSIKEASLYLGDLVSKLPVEKEIDLGLLSKDTIIRIGEELKILLCEIKHRGAFEQAYIGFIQLVNSLWKCPDKDLSDLPRQWLEDITSQLESPLGDQKVRLCSTRRSAGLPFLVQAIICSEIVSIKSTSPASLHTTMKSLLRITENGVARNPEAKIHALNVLRALFKHAQLGEHVASYVAQALMAAIRGSRAESWSERNSSSLLFSSLVIRIFGVSRSREEISKKNRMTSRTFFQRYAELYDFLLMEMELVYSKENYADGIQPKPSLYLVLLILGRLYPPPAEDPDNIDLSEFLPYINMSRKNSIMKIRELGARALVPLIPFDRLPQELDRRFSDLSSENTIVNNERHGILLQIKELLSQSRESLSKGSLEKKIRKWIENTKWMLEHKRTPLVILSGYVKILHILFKSYPSARKEIMELVMSTSVCEKLERLSPPEQRLLPGIFLFLENFYFLKTDIVANQWDDHGGREKILEFLLHMLTCKIIEVQSIPLKILSHVLRYDCAAGVDEDDFCGITAPVTDLLLFSSKESAQRLQTQILESGDVLRCLVQQVNNDSGALLKSTVIQRLWLKAVSTLALRGIIPVSPSVCAVANPAALKIDFAKSLVKSGDKDLSTSAVICYALYLMEEASATEASTEDHLLLSDIFHEFSRSDADAKERLAIAKIMNRCCESFVEKHNIADPVTLNVWMIPFKLIVDEDAEVRGAAAELVHTMQCYILRETPPERMIIKMKTLEWPHLPLVSLKAQESLLDSYINILGRENLFYLLTQMLIMSVSALCGMDDSENFSKDEFGVFEKGNPNPYCEDLALSNLMCDKIQELRLILDLEALLWNDLSDSLSSFVAQSLRLSEFTPKCLMEVVETVTTLVEETDPSKGEFSIPRIQVKNLRAALGMTEEKINGRVAEAFHEEKLKSKGLSALRRNVEKTCILTRICRRKHERNVKYKCWHQWKHYTEKRAKVKEIKLLADRIREERLSIRCLYLWSFRLREKRFLQNACKNAERRHEMKLKDKYFSLWKTFTEKQVCKARIGKLARSRYEEKLKEKFIGCWRRYTIQRKRYRYQMKIIHKFYENYLLKNYLSRWTTAYGKLKFDRKMRRLNLATNFHNRKLLEKSFKILRTIREAKKAREEKLEKFQEAHMRIYLGFYLSLWSENRRKKMVCDHLEKKAKQWREDRLRESFLSVLLKKYQERLEEKEELANVIKYSDAIILHRAFRGWADVTNSKIKKQIQYENAAKFHFEKLTKKAFDGWKEFRLMRNRKKMVGSYYRNVLLSRVMEGWKAFLVEQRKKLTRAEDLARRLNVRLMRNAFESWRDELKTINSKLDLAVDFHEKLKLSRAFRGWRNNAKAKAMRKTRFNRNTIILSGIIIKDVIFCWYEMYSAKLNLKPKLEGFRSKRENRLLGSHFNTWNEFVKKMKSLRENMTIYSQIRSSLLKEDYLAFLWEAAKTRKIFKRKSEMARRAEEKILKRKYFKKWLSFICWKRERILKCLTEERKCDSRVFELFVPPVGQTKRRQPVIPDFLKIECGGEDDVDQLTSRVLDPVNKKLPIIGRKDAFVSFEI